MDKIEAALTKKKTMIMNRKRGKKPTVSLQSSDGEEVKSDVASEYRDQEEEEPVDPNAFLAISKVEILEKEIGDKSDIRPVSPAYDKSRDNPIARDLRIRPPPEHPPSNKGRDSDSDADYQAVSSLASPPSSPRKSPTKDKASENFSAARQQPAGLPGL